MLKLVLTAALTVVAAHILTGCCCCYPPVGGGDFTAVDLVSPQAKAVAEHVVTDAIDQAGAQRF